MKCFITSGSDMHCSIEFSANGLNLATGLDKHTI